MKKTFFLVLLLIFGFLFRIWFASLVPQPFVFDQEEYYGFALGIIREGLHADIYRLYGYPLIITPLIYFWGVKSALPWTIFHSLLDTTTALLIFWIGEKIISGALVGIPWFSSRQGPDVFLFRKDVGAKAVTGLRKGMPPRAIVIYPAWIAFILYLFNPFTAGYVGVLLSEVMTIFFVTVISALILKYIEKKSTRILYLLALFLGFLPQVRPAFVYFSFIILLVLFTLERVNRKRLVAFLLFALPFSYNIITNYVSYNEFAPLSVDRVFAREFYSSLFIGRGLAFTDTQFGVWPSQALEVWGELARPKNTKERDIVANKYIDLALQKIQGDPMGYLGSRIAKMGYVWEKHFVFPYDQGRPSEFTKALIYWGNITILGLGVIGFIGWIRKIGEIRAIREKNIKLFFAGLVVFFILYISAVHAISTSEERFSLPAYPVIFLFSGYGIWIVVGGFKKLSTTA